MTSPSTTTGSGGRTGATPTRVGVNLLWLVPGVVGGTEEYTTRLLRALNEAAPPDLAVTLFVLAPFVEAHPDLAEAFPTVVLGVDGRHKPQRVAAESTWLVREARRHRIELLHHAGGVIPPGPGISRIPAVLTIHDLQPLVAPENFSAVKRRWLASMLPRSAARARLILTPSDPSSASVVEHLGVPADRVLTVPHGVEAPDPLSPEVIGEVRDRYRLGDRSILYPAITYPHKDHTTLIRAFTRLADDLGEMLHDVTAEGDVQHLAPPAHGQDGHVARERVECGAGTSGRRCGCVQRARPRLPAGAPAGDA